MDVAKSEEKTPTPEASPIAKTATLRAVKMPDSSATIAVLQKQYNTGDEIKFKEAIEVLILKAFRDSIHELVGLKPEQITLVEIFMSAPFIKQVEHWFKQEKQKLGLGYLAFIMGQSIHFIAYWFGSLWLMSKGDPRGLNFNYSLAKLQKLLHNVINSSFARVNAPDLMKIIREISTASKITPHQLFVLHIELINLSGDYFEYGADRLGNWLCREKILELVAQNKSKKIRSYTDQDYFVPERIFEEISFVEEINQQYGAWSPLLWVHYFVTVGSLLEISSKKINPKMINECFKQALVAMLRFTKDLQQNSALLDDSNIPYYSNSQRYRLPFSINGSFTEALKYNIVSQKYKDTGEKLQGGNSSFKIENEIKEISSMLPTSSG